MHMRVVDFLLKPVDLSRLTNLVRNELGTPPQPKAPPPPPRVRPRPEKPKAKAKIVALKSA
ncbi:hypothetical protein D3C81_2289380 [compost metagenome]